MKSEQYLIWFTETGGETNCLRCAAALKISAFQSLSRENICGGAFHTSLIPIKKGIKKTLSFTTPLPRLKKLSLLPAVACRVQHRRRAASGQSQRWSYSSGLKRRSESAWQHSNEHYINTKWNTSEFLANVGAAIAKNKFFFFKVKPLKEMLKATIN